MTTLVSDTFTDTNGTQLTAHTPDTDDVGTGWENAAWAGATPGANAEIQSNQASITTDNMGAVIDAGTADCIITVDWTPAVGVANRNSVFFRYSDSDNQWTFNVREDNGDWRVIVYNGGTDTTEDSGSFTFTEGTTYELKVELNGSSIKCYIDGVEKSSLTNSTHLSETKHGIHRAGGNNATRFDNFLIETLPSADPEGRLIGGKLVGGGLLLSGVL